LIYRPLVRRAVAAVDDLVQRARERLGEGAFSDARAAVDEAFGLAPDDPAVRTLYQDVHLAHAIRLSREARERRRQEIEARGRPGEAFEDSDAVKAVFREMVEAFDRVLAVNPDHAKAHGLKGQTLVRLDRGNRPAALAEYDAAIRALEATLPEGPARETGRRNLLGDRRRIEVPCEWCDDTGFCTECGGGGWRSLLGVRLRCDACNGHGICKRCGVL
jgi:tetratricopeptide (TPR) repeat protein